MASVSLQIYGRSYTVGCGDGQEERVRQLAREFDASVRHLAAEVGAIGEMRLFLMAALTVADASVETRQRLSRAEAEIESLRARLETAEARAAEIIDAAAERLERLAEPA